MSQTDHILSAHSSGSISQGADKYNISSSLYTVGKTIVGQWMQVKCNFWLENARSLCSSGRPPLKWEMLAFLAFSDGHAIQNLKKPTTFHSTIYGDLFKRMAKSEHLNNSLKTFICFK